MDNVFFLRLIISFFAGGGIVLLVIFLAQKLGSRLGGLLSGFPTIIFISLLLIGIFKSSEAAQDASISALVSLSFFGVFACLYVQFYKNNLLISLSSAILGWLFAASIFNEFEINTFWTSLLIFICIVSGSLIILKFQDIPTCLSKGLQIPKWSYVLRFMLGGLTVSGAFFFSVVSGEKIGGILASFPALAISSIIILNHLEGKEFTANFIKNVFLSASINCGLYIVSVYYTYAYLGVIWGTVVSSIISFISIVTLIVIKRLKV